ncbi:hypothetical protein AGMMS4952_25810 [Spirochaetia bacterium]|nr:hypothetical protein AGMMS4952_25810 [Spirochaetia bacterium]
MAANAAIYGNFMYGVDFVATIRFSATKTKPGIQLINFVRNRHP